MERFIDYGKKYGRDLLVILLLLLCIALIIYKFYLTSDDAEVTSESIALLDPVSEESNKEETEITEVYVDIKGAVKTPGVYKMSSDAIINDVVTMAGGFKSNAYKNGINLSKKVSNEMVVYVYTKSEISAAKKEQENATKTSEESNQVCECPTYDITECVEDTKSVIETKPSENSSSNSNNSTNNSNSNNTDSSTNTDTKNDSTSSEDVEEAKLININTASVSELTSLNGVGESKAQAIIAYREENGKFTDINAIMNVSGIGEALFAKIKDYITV